MSQDGANMATEGAQPRPVGSVVRSRYKILAVVGRGGLGVVYRVSDILFSSNNVFALKELADPAPGARQQFELESRWLQALDHNNIPRVRESFEWDGRSYLVMDYVDGENLEQYLRRLGHPLPEDQALRWMLPICDALQYLHTRTPPLLHRDVKPANIIVTPGGHPVLVDFGIAKAHLPGMNQTLTFVRKAGTEGYAPPEQYAATGLTGPWSDVYALGATLYQLLTGQVPQTAVERITGVSPMPRPHALNPLVTPGTDATIMRALELKPANRFQTVMEFAAKMMEALQLSRFDSNPPDVSPLTSSPGATSAISAISAISQPPPGRTPSETSWPRAGAPAAQSSGPYAPAAPRTPSPRTPSPPAPTSLPPLLSPLPSNLPHMGQAGHMGQQPRRALNSGALAASAGAQATPSAAPPRISAPSIAGARTATQMPAPKPARRGPPLAVLIGLLAVLMVAVGALSLFAYDSFAPPDRSTPQASVTGYFDALEQQNYGRAWQFSAASRNDPSAQASFATALSTDDARYGKVMRFSVTSSQTDSTGHTDVTVSVTRASTPTAPLTYAVSVTQYGGSLWLIDSASNQ